MFVFVCGWYAYMCVCVIVLLCLCCSSYVLFPMTCLLVDHCHHSPEPLEDMAATIYHSVGPSGPNKVYLLELDRALLQLGIKDDHVHELAQAVRAL